MTTQNWVFPIEHSSDATFRAWGQDVSAKLALVGLVKTADTGQINWATATRPVTGLPAYAGYEIWRYPDSTVFMKWEFGSASNAGCPSIRISIGTGSNGSGTLTGPVTAARAMNASVVNLTAAGTNRQSLMIYKDRFFGFFGYLDSAVSGDMRTLFFLAVAPTVNANGVPTNDGLTIYYHPVTAAVAPVQAVNFGTSTVGSIVTAGTYAIVPYSITSSLVGADVQTFLNWTVLPPASVRPMMHLVSVVASEFPTSNTFQTTVIGTTPQTYIALDTTVYGAATGANAYKLAMLWE